MIHYLLINIVMGILITVQQNDSCLQSSAEGWNSNRAQLLLHLHLFSSAFYFCCLCCVSTDWTFQMCVCIQCLPGGMWQDILLHCDQHQNTDSPIAKYIFHFSLLNQWASYVHSQVSPIHIGKLSGCLGCQVQCWVWLNRKHHNVLRMYS